MKKRNAIVVTCIIVVLAFLIGMFFAFQGSKPKTYSTAKRQSIRVLDAHQSQMEELAVNALKSEESTPSKFRDYSYHCNQNENYVQFDVDAQGMLGGQYWALIYTQDGTYYGETEVYRYDETSGNNIVKAEKLNEHWWFQWIDYDGTARSES